MSIHSLAVLALCYGVERVQRDVQLFSTVPTCDLIQPAHAQDLNLGAISHLFVPPTLTGLPYHYGYTRLLTCTAGALLRTDAKVKHGDGRHFP